MAHSAGKAVITPRVKTEWRHESNYFKRETDERAVSTLAIKPGIQLGYTTTKSRLILDAFLDFQNYHDEDDLPVGEPKADQDDYTGQAVTLTAESQVFKRLALGLDEAYLKTRDPANSDTFNNLTDRNKYTINRVTPRLVYKFGEKFGLFASYTHTLIDYDPSASEDSTENRGRFDLFYNLNKRTSLDFDYQIWLRDYDKTTSDYTSNQFMLNLTRKYKFFSFTGGVGYHDRNFDKESVQDIDEISWKVSFTGQSQGVPENPDQSKSFMTLSISRNLNDLGTGEQYYTATRFDAILGHTFLRKIDTRLKGYFQLSDYQFSEREDDTWNLAFDGTYRVKEWLSMGGEVGYENRSSNENDRDYDNTYAMVKAELTYDFASR